MKSWLLLLALSARAYADVSAPPPADGLRLKRVDVHTAVRLVAVAHRLNVITIGGRAIDVSVNAPDAEAAMNGIAAAAGLAVARRGNLWFIAPPAMIAALPARVSFTGGRRVDLDFVRAGAGNLMHLFGDVDQRVLTSGLAGEASMLVRNIPVRDLVSWLAALASAPLSAKKQHSMTIGDGLFPPSSAPAPEYCPEHNGTQLPCVAADKLELVGVVGQLALVRAVAGEPPRSALVRVGDRLGGAQAIVRVVVADHLELDGGMRVPLVK